MTKFADFIKREPVMGGAAIVAVFEAAAPGASTAWKLAVGAVVAWLVRSVSTPTQKAEQDTAKAATAAADEREVQVHADLGTLALAKPQRARGTAKKAAG